MTGCHELTRLHLPALLDRIRALLETVKSGDESFLNGALALLKSAIRMAAGARQ